MEAAQDSQIELTVNGKKVGMNPYVQLVFTNVVLGLIKSLKNIGDSKEIVLKIKN
jgi:hypothetical protein